MDQSVEADLFVYGDAFNPQAGFSTELGTDLQQLAVQRPDLVKSAMTMRWTLGGVKIDDGFKDVVAADLAVLDEHMNLQMIEGSAFHAETNGVLVPRRPGDRSGAHHR